jgi:putative DNA primase/helicase
MSAAMLDAITRRRCQLRQRGYAPIPLFGKEPPQYGKNNQRGGLAGWTKLTDVSYEQITLWSRTWPSALNTGVLTKYTPALDLDILNEAAAIAAEDLIREKFEERGWFLVRVGRAPKRLILFRSDEPFEKLTINFLSEHNEKIEFLANGQQCAVSGDHPPKRDSPIAGSAVNRGRSSATSYPIFRLMRRTN